MGTFHVVILNSGVYTVLKLPEFHKMCSSEYKHTLSCVKISMLLTAFLEGTGRTEVCEHCAVRAEDRPRQGPPYPAFHCPLAVLLSLTH